MKTYLILVRYCPRCKEQPKGEQRKGEQRKGEQPKGVSASKGETKGLHEWEEYGSTGVRVHGQDWTECALDLAGSSG